MRVVSWNVNGLRAAIRKGIDRFVDELDPDVLMLQEIRSLPEQLPIEWLDGLEREATWHPAERKGYSGVATLSKGGHRVHGTGLAGADDPEGRVLVTLSHGWRFVNVYLPSGSSRPERQEVKEAWMDLFAAWTSTFVDDETPTIIAGDLNIAHTERDIWNAKSNAKTSGFLPHERAWFTEWLAQGWTDSLRHLLGEVQGPYSWWSNRGRARELDRGWRIDYLVVNPAGSNRIKASGISRQGGLEVSDHAPVWLDLA